MSVTKRGNSWQVYLVVNGHKVRESYPTQATAITREAALKVAGITGVEIAPADKADVSLTMAQLRDKVVARVYTDHKTGEHSAYLADKVVEALGRNVSVTLVNTLMIDRFIGQLEDKGNSNGTINRKLAVLSGMLSFAKARGYIAAVPHVQYKKAPKGRERYLTLKEEGKVLALLKLWSKFDEHDLVVFLLDTGCRVGEALKLEWRDVSGGRTTFRDTKNGTTRSIPLTLRVRVSLIRPEGEHDDVKPFGHLSYPDVRLLWDRVRQHMGLSSDKQFVIHALRHTCASRLVQRGAQIQYVKEWLGHKNINITMRYSHLAPESLDSMVALLEQQPTEKPRHLGVVEGGQS